MSNRILRFAIVIAMVLVCVAAFGAGAKQGGTPGKFTYWDRSEYVKTYADMQKERVTKFGADNGLTIEYILIAPGDIKAKLSAAIEANQLPDLVAMDGSITTQFVDTKKFISVADFLKEIDFNETALRLAKKIEGNYEVPLYIVPNVLYGRMDKMQSKGITKMPSNWDEILDAARKTNDPANDFYGCGFQLAPVSAGDCEGFCESLMVGYGGYIVDENGKVVVKQYAEQIKKALAVAKTIYDEKLVPPSAITGDNAWNNEQFLAGKIGFTLNAGSILSAARGQNPALAKVIGIAAYPAGPVSRLGSGGQMSFMIPASGNVTAAKKFIKDYFYNRDYYTKLIEGLLGLAVPTLNGFDKNPFYQDPINKGFYDAGMALRPLGYPAPPDGRASQVSSEAVRSQIVQDMIMNNRSFDYAIDRLDKEIRRIYNQ
ncbi:MAG: extracellular solute-binding protein [Treponema sp.]|nr:extracellular solute-binding protein [Treponema sp.]